MPSLSTSAAASTRNWPDRSAGSQHRGLCWGFAGSEHRAGLPSARLRRARDCH